MAVTIKSLIEGHNAGVNKDGGFIVQWYKLKGLTASDTILIDAILYMQANGFEYGAERAGASGYFLTQLKPAHCGRSKTEARVMVEWRTPDPSSWNPTETIVNFHGTTRELPTERRADRSIIHVFYKAPGEEFYRKRVGRVTGTKATGVLECIREVPYDPTPHLRMLNKVNGSSYRDQPKWTWFVRDISISKILHRPGFRETLQVEYDEEGFRKAALFVDENTGQVPNDIVSGYDPDADSGNGYENVLAQFEADLNELEIPHTAGSF